MKTDTRYSQNRKRLVNARMTDGEYKRLRRYAHAHGLSLSHIMRDRLSDIIRIPDSGSRSPAKRRGGKK